MLELLLVDLRIKLTAKSSRQIPLKPAEMRPTTASIGALTEVADDIAEAQIELWSADTLNPICREKMIMSIK